MTAMSSRIESPWGSLGGRLAATAAAAEERRQAEAPVPDRMAESWLADGSVPEGGEERAVEQGRWVEYRFGQRWLPAFLIAWRRENRSGPWLARVVLVTEPGVAAEALIHQDLVRVPASLPPSK